MTKKKDNLKSNMNVFNTDPFESTIQEKNPVKEIIQDSENKNNNIKDQHYNSLIPINSNTIIVESESINKDISTSTLLNNKTLTVEDSISNDAKYLNLYPLIVRLEDHQLSFITNLEHLIMKNRKIGFKKERITKAMIIRCLIKLLESHINSIDIDNISDENELYKRIQDIIQKL